MMLITDAALGVSLSSTWVVLWIIAQIFQILWRYRRLSRSTINAVSQEWILSAGQLADIGTKPLGGPTLEMLMKYLFVIVPQELVQEG